MSVPWNDPDADPIQDLRDAWEKGPSAGRLPAYEVHLPEWMLRAIKQHEEQA